jgi:hypothetical protein
VPSKKLDMQLPLGLHADDDVNMLASDGDGGLIFSTHGDAHIFYLSPITGRVQILAGPELTSGDGSSPDKPDDLSDWWPGSGWSAPDLPELASTTLDSQGDFLFVEDAGDSNVSTLVRIHIGLNPPAHLQAPPPDQGLTSGHIATRDPEQLSTNFGSLLESGQGADVELMCAGEEVVRAHSTVLTAQWEWFRIRQASGMTAATSAGPGTASADADRKTKRARTEQGAAAGATQGENAATEPRAACVAKVDVRDYSAATMQLVMQHLYTGRVQLGKFLGKSSAQGDGAQGHGQSKGGDQHQHAMQHDADHMSEVISVLSAASYFLLPDLHTAVVAVAQKLFSPRTALTWLKAAIDAGDAELQQVAYDFTKSNIAGTALTRALA